MDFPVTELLQGPEHRGTTACARSAHDPNGAERGMPLAACARAARDPLPLPMKYTVSIFKRIDVDAIDEEEAVLRAREKLPQGFDGYQLTVSRGESHHTPTESEQPPDD